MLPMHFGLCIYTYRHEEFRKLISSYDTKARFIPSIFTPICLLQQILESAFSFNFLQQVTASAPGPIWQDTLSDNGSI